MKNIDELLKDAGIEVPEDKREAFNKAFAENYKTVADYDRQKVKLSQAEDKAKAAEDGLKAFNGVNVDDLKNQIAKLTADLKAKDTEHAAELEKRDISDAVAAAIRDMKGRDDKAIIAHLDMEKITQSRDRKSEIAAQLKGVKETKDFLFEPDAPQATGNKVSVGAGITGPTQHAKKEFKNIY